MKKKKITDGADYKMVLKSTLISAFIGLGLCALFVVLLSFGLVKSGKLPDGILPFVLKGVILGCAVLSGYIAARIRCRQGIGMGALCGIFFVFSLIILKAVFGCKEYSLNFVLVAVAVELCSAIGGLLGVNAKSKIKLSKSNHIHKMNKYTIYK